MSLSYWKIGFSSTLKYHRLGKFWALTHEQEFFWVFNLQWLINHYKKFHLALSSIKLNDKIFEIKPLFWASFAQKVIEWIFFKNWVPSVFKYYHYLKQYKYPKKSMSQFHTCKWIDIWRYWLHLINMHVTKNIYKTKESEKWPCSKNFNTCHNIFLAVASWL